jgi:succinate dehydrogenase/fumarate reductase flavoprotein subunit
VQISYADVWQCDVLIIGGGVTALVAGLEARKAVDDVVMVCKVEGYPSSDERWLGSFHVAKGAG